MTSIYDSEVLEDAAALLYCHENGIWEGRAAKVWAGLSDAAREDCRARTRKHIAEYEAMPEEWRRAHNKKSLARTLEINEAAIPTLSSGPTDGSGNAMVDTLVSAVARAEDESLSPEDYNVALRAAEEAITQLVEHIRKLEGGVA